MDGLSPRKLDAQSHPSYIITLFKLLQIDISKISKANYIF